MYAPLFPNNCMWANPCLLRVKCMAGVYFCKHKDKSFHMLAAESMAGSGREQMRLVHFARDSLKTLKCFLSLLKCRKQIKLGGSRASYIFRVANNGFRKKGLSSLFFFFLFRHGSWRRRIILKSA